MQNIDQQHGLTPAQFTESRCECIAIHNATLDLGDFLRRMWQSRTPKEAHDVLSRDDVTVTNQADKDQQLPKLLQLQDEVQRQLGGGETTRGSETTRRLMTRRSHLDDAADEAPRLPGQSVRAGAGTRRGSTDAPGRRQGSGPLTDRSLPPKASSSIEAAGVRPLTDRSPETNSLAYSSDLHA